MKKSMIAMLGGVVFGMVLMLGVFSLLNLKPSNENILAQDSVEKDESVFEPEDIDWDEDAEEDTGILPLGKIFSKKDNMLDDVEVTEEVTQSNVTNAPAKLPYYIKVNRLANCVTVYTLDAEGNYTVPIKAMTCSVGTNWSTPLGVSKISDKYTWRLLFGNTFGHYSVRFNGHILFHSVPYLASSNGTLKDGQFNMLGQPASQGCIRLCVADAKWIYDNCAKGTIVEVYDSEDPGPLGKPIMPQISLNSPYKGWDPTDPNPANPWLYGAVTIQGATDHVLTVGETINLLSGVSATDVDGLALEVGVNGKVDFNTAGVYQVTYSTTGVLGHTVSQTITITVMASQEPGLDTENMQGSESQGVQVPSTEVPNIEMPSTEVPNIDVPSTEVPSTEMPNVEMPSTEVPNIEVPSTEVPNVDVLYTESQEIHSGDAQGVEGIDTQTQSPEVPVGD